MPPVWVGKIRGLLLGIFFSILNPHGLTFHMILDNLLQFIMRIAHTKYIISWKLVRFSGRVVTDLSRGILCPILLESSLRP
jgi:hypothetical protein